MRELRQTAVWRLWPRSGRSAGKQCFVSSMTAFVEDLKELAEKEEPIYVGLAVLLCCIILAIFMDSWMIPVAFMAGIGMAILYNLGSNFFLGQVSYITKALSAVLQLGVTMDYSIFLWHSYEEQRQDPSKDKKTPPWHRRFPIPSHLLQEVRSQRLQVSWLCVS